MWIYGKVQKGGCCSPFQTCIDCPHEFAESMVILDHHMSKLQIGPDQEARYFLSNSWINNLGMHFLFVARLSGNLTFQQLIWLGSYSARGLH